MSTKITAPILFTGETTVGVVSLEFTDGVAEFDGTLSQEAAALLRSNGYTVSAPLIVSDATVDESPLVADEEEAGEESGIPAKNASKAEWVDFGVTQGHDRGSLEEMTRTQIQTVLDED